MKSIQILYTKNIINLLLSSFFIKYNAYKNLQELLGLLFVQRDQAVLVHLWAQFLQLVQMDLGHQHLPETGL